MAILIFTEDAALLTEYLSTNEHEIVYVWSSTIMEHSGLEGHVLSGLSREDAEKYGAWTEILELPEPPKTTPPKPKKKAKGGKQGGSKATQPVRSGE